MSLGQVLSTHIMAAVDLTSMLYIKYKEVTPPTMKATVIAR